MMLSYPYAVLPVVIVVGMTATIAVPLFAFVWLVFFLVVALVAVMAVGWGLVAALRAVGSWLWGAVLMRPSGKGQGEAFRCDGSERPIGGPELGIDRADRGGRTKGTTDLAADALERLSES